MGIEILLLVLGPPEFLLKLDESQFGFQFVSQLLLNLRNMFVLHGWSISQFGLALRICNLQYVIYTNILHIIIYSVKGDVLIHAAWMINRYPNLVLHYKYVICNIYNIYTNILYIIYNIVYNIPVKGDIHIHIVM